MMEVLKKPSKGLVPSSPMQVEHLEVLLRSVPQALLLHCSGHPDLGEAGQTLATRLEAKKSEPDIKAVEVHLLLR